MKRSNRKHLAITFSKFYVIYLVLIVAGVMAIPQIQNISSSNGITGLVILEETEIKDEFEYAVPEIITKDTALDALINAENIILELSNNDVNVLFIQDNLLEAQRYFIGNEFELFKQEIKEEESPSKIDYLNRLIQVYKETPGYEIKEKDLSETIKLTQLIEFKRNQAYDIIDTLSLLEDKENEYNSKGINTIESLEFLEEAKIILPSAPAL